MAKRWYVMIAMAGLVRVLSIPAQTAPAPVGPVPSAKQVEWYHREIMAFFHFGINPFTGSDGVNEGDGTASASLFNPTALDCSQWMRVLKSAGIPCAILTAKHADGFCNWPTAFTAYSLKNSPWKSGRGDVVKEFTDACHAAGIKAGIYLGPHDRHDGSYGTPAYSTYYANQLSELLRNYGTIVHMWWDGAGADQISAAFYTRWHDSVQALQPDCTVFGAKNAAAFADSRWVGNESGIAGDPCWSTINRSMIQVENTDSLNAGEINGSAYVGAEVDVSIRPSWFYHTAEDGQVKSAAMLWNIYFNSVGRNSVLLLNFPPDKRGLIHRVDSLKADSLGQWVYGTFRTNLAAGAGVISQHSRGSAFAATNLVDTLESTYFSTPDGIITDTVVFNLGASKMFDVVMVQEVIELGHRTTGWSVDYSTNGTSWTAIPAATGKQCIGYKWLIKFAPVSASYIRLRIISGKACPAIHTFGIYKQQMARRPDQVSTARSSDKTAVTLPAAFVGKQVGIDVIDLRGRLVQSMKAGAEIAGQGRIPRGPGIFLIRGIAEKRMATLKRIVINH